MFSKSWFRFLLNLVCSIVLFIVVFGVLQNIFTDYDGMFLGTIFGIVLMFIFTLREDVLYMADNFFTNALFVVLGVLSWIVYAIGIIFGAAQFFSNGGEDTSAIIAIIMPTLSFLMTFIFGESGVVEDYWRNYITPFGTLICGGLSIGIAAITHATWVALIFLLGGLAAVIILTKVGYYSLSNVSYSPKRSERSSYSPSNTHSQSNCDKTGLYYKFNGVIKSVVPSSITLTWNATFYPSVTCQISRGIVTYYISGSVNLNSDCEGTDEEARRINNKLMEEVRYLSSCLRESANELFLELKSSGVDMGDLYKVVTKMNNITVD